MKLIVLLNRYKIKESKIKCNTAIAINELAQGVPTAIPSFHTCTN